MISFGIEKPRRKPNLTPMIDVVFLLLVFFMLASRFGADRALPLTVTGSGGSYNGPPRLVELVANEVRLNGVVMSQDELIETLQTLTESGEDAIILRARDEANLQALVHVMDGLTAAGFSRLVLVE
ncbi:MULTISPECIES: ExbD/TolR family protein [Pacificibacter]|uniref:ExbD/TolR family protein n=1 Tax=Pacificibacter TaxID=1042323 RepID=UPI001C08D6CA|nr:MULTISPECIES: biopolymer transporter ExbD [Pacificibacter]MBU2936080.1 biopolymer transporter ExbD [Pacificibacter marinus]MDO6615071.1 biopolymer transporter ExbD [Pacificibacter sp. 1_MG-2023]